MGRFFNQKVMNATGKLLGKKEMESLRKQFNEEHKNVKPLHSQAPEEAGIVNTEVGQQGESQPIIPARRGRPRGTRRTHQGGAGKAGGNRRG